MKKILLIAAVAGLGTVACQKDRTCSCTTTYPGGSTSQDYILKDATKNQAKAYCVSTTETTGTITTTSDCKLK
jgi:hypothetical protein